MKATISTGYDKRLLDVFAAEDHDIGRASYTYQQVGDELVFSIQGDDATALRAVLNAITKLLSTWERSQGL